MLCVLSGLINVKMKLQIFLGLPSEWNHLIQQAVWIPNWKQNKTNLEQQSTSWVQRANNGLLVFMAVPCFCSGAAVSWAAFLWRLE